MKLALVMAVLFVLLIPAFTGAVEPSVHRFRYKYASVEFGGVNSTLSIIINDTQKFRICFKRIYVGTLPANDNTPATIFFGSADLTDMNVDVDKGWTKEYGNYTHVKMWKNITLKSMFSSTAYALVNIDFYITERDYYKKNVHIGNDTIRFDIHIKTNAKDSFVFLEQQISAYSGSVPMVPLEHTTGDSWIKIRKMTSPVEHYFSADDMGVVGFGEDMANFELMWDYDNIQTLYKYSDDTFSIFFAFPNTQDIVQDPYIKLPVPLIPIPGGEVVNKTVNFIMEHAISLGIGIGIAAIIVAAPIIVRKIRL